MTRYKSLLIWSSAALAVVVAAASLWVHRQFRADLRVAEARITIGSEIVQTPCGPIEYATAGKGPAVLMVHGSGGGFDQGLQFADPLIRGGFKVISPSRFGYLRTPLPRDASPRAQAEAHRCLLDALGIGSVAAVGGSAGAPSVVQLCLRYPQRCSAMALVVPAIFVPDPTHPTRSPSAFSMFVIRTSLRSDFAFWSASQIARGTVIEFVLGTPMADVTGATPDERDRVFQVLQNIQPVSRRAAGLGVDATLTTAPAEVDFEHIAAPTFIVTTANDGFGTAEAARIAAQRVPRIRLVVYPNGGHLWVGHQAELWSEVQHFLRENDSATSTPTPQLTDDYPRRDPL